ncbi:MAG: acetyl-CoA C-acetyltransferase [Desulfarculus sp.]|nr:acetyl-CoA C-acetyltransferase [Pseudomonadota bacterium]MBV1717454.1 acetyl-CoA C-acetyltransferase [Desulfarculus sp.]MBU4577049.1 acetyl-CoA C-acetyltransferase [Pseudomonadota bacterium]MBU4598751.1 acetyl-CoA C-acetyltransferase [Pseudomonadota bacterium]MBV1740024.1 acetyl-CoA C-acetyltransferase [Desulfarculus sp.]
MREAVIVGYLRSPMSRSRPGDIDRASRDVFNDLRMDELAAEVVNEMFARTGVDKADVDEFVTGCALGVGENWSWGGRAIPLLAEFPVKVPAKMIDQQCCSSMAAVQLGAMEIMLGMAEVAVAVGIEHMTHVAMVNNFMVQPSPKFLEEPKYFVDRDIATALSMGLTAEKLAKQSGITREEMDQWSVRSHQLAAKALEEGFFADEIMPVKVQTPAGEMVVDHDVSIRKGASLEDMAKLRPAFKLGGVITAGNSSPVNAGASAMIVMSKDAARARGLKPLATIRAMASYGVEPSVMGEGPVPAAKRALQQAGLEAADIDLWEINEAFAVVTLNAIKELGLDPDKVNVKGGAIALGHPLGVTGTRMLGTVGRLLNQQGKRYGLATACIGGGQGSATIIEREEYDW